MILGIDEAGRGPIIGPLVMAGVLINESQKPILKNLGIKDSKLLSQDKREILYDKIIENSLNHKIIIVQPEEIDNALKNPTLNLNRLEAIKSSEIINEFNPETAILDCPTHTPSQYKNYIKKFINNPKIKLIIEHKADLNYISSSAASILAKVTREIEVKKLKEKIGIDFGSGYQSDPLTQEFIKNHWQEHSSLMRKTWETYKRLIRQKEQKNLMNFV